MLITILLPVYLNVWLSIVPKYTHDQQLVVHENHAALQCVVPYYWKNKRGKTNTYNKEVRWTPADFYVYIFFLVTENHATSEY